MWFSSLALYKMLNVSFHMFRRNDILWRFYNSGGYEVLFANLKKIVLYILGFLFLGIGITGYFLPGLPGTVFLILAAVCFMRSNEKMYRWVTEHRLFGSQIKQFMETGAMPKRAKIISVSCIWFFSIISISPITPYGWLFKVIVLALAVIGTLYILTRPTSK